MTKSSTGWKSSRMSERRVLIPCSGLTELFYSDDPVDQSQARALCRECPVRVRCLETAVARKEKHGVWGGRTFKQKRRRKAPPES